MPDVEDVNLDQDNLSLSSQRTDSSPYPTWVDPTMRRPPAVGVSTDEEALLLAMELEQVLFVDGQSPKGDATGPSSDMHKTLSTDA